MNEPTIDSVSHASRMNGSDYETMRFKLASRVKAQTHLEQNPIASSESSSPLEAYMAYIE